MITPMVRRACSIAIGAMLALSSGPVLASSQRKTPPPSQAAPESASPGAPEPASQGSQKRPDEAKPPRRLHFGFSTKVVEIITLTPAVGHNVTLLSAGLFVAFNVTPRWSLVGGVGFATAIDGIGMGGSAGVGAKYMFFQRGPFRLGVGPNFGFVHSRVDLGPPGWMNVTIVGPGAGFVIGYKRVSITADLGVPYTPRFESWSLAPAVGLGVAF